MAPARKPKAPGHTPAVARAKRERATADTEQRRGRVAIVGRPNAGKSTLLNALVGTKLAIATERPGTTRNTLLGVALRDDPPTQIDFIDTPGMHRPKSALGSVLVDEARAGLADVDAVVLVVTCPSDAAVARARGAQRPPSAEDLEALALAKEAEKPVILALNKVDQLRNKQAMLPLLEQWQALYPFAAIIPISARKELQLDALVAELRKLLPVVSELDEDALTDRSERFLAAERVREAAIRNTHAEVPHGVAVHIDQFIDVDGRSRIMATLLVEKESHKGIVVGRGGSMIKTIGSEARQDLEALLGRPVHLELFVRVAEGWTRDPNKARELVRDVEGS